MPEFGEQGYIWAMWCYNLFETVMHLSLVISRQMSGGNDAFIASGQSLLDSLYYFLYHIFISRHHTSEPGGAWGPANIQLEGSTHQIRI